MHVQIKRGEVFVSETDTEVIPKLCNYIYNSTQEKLPFNEVCPISSYRTFPRGMTTLTSSPLKAK